MGENKELAEELLKSWFINNWVDLLNYDTKALQLIVGKIIDVARIFEEQAVIEMEQL